MKEDFFKVVHKAIGTKGIVLALVAILVIGGVGGVVLQRVVLPYLSTWPILRDWSWLQPQAPIVITRREEVRITEGINQAEVVAKARDSLVTVYLHQGAFDSGSFRVTGVLSGVVVSSDGLVIVPAAQLDLRSRLTAVGSGGGAYAAELVASDDLTGLALLKLPANNLSVVGQGFTREINAGQKLLVIQPKEIGGQMAVQPATATDSGRLQPSLLATYSFNPLNQFLTLDIELTASMLGATVLDEKGQLVGVVVEIEGEVLVVRAEELRLFLSNYLDDQEIHWPRLSLTYQILGPDQTNLLNMSKSSGILIKSAPRPLQSDDFVYAVDDIQLTLEEGFQQRLLGRSAGETVKLKLIRDGEEREVELSL